MCVACVCCVCVCCVCVSPPCVVHKSTSVNPQNDKFCTVAVVTHRLGGTNSASKRHKDRRRRTSASGKSETCGAHVIKPRAFSWSQGHNEHSIDLSPFQRSWSPQKKTHRSPGRTNSKQIRDHGHDEQRGTTQRRAWATPLMTRKTESTPRTR